jgi:hypothetical protein
MLQDGATEECFMTNPTVLFRQREEIRAQQRHLLKADAGKSPAMRRLDDTMCGVQTEIDDTLRRTRRANGNNGFTRT